MRKSSVRKGFINIGTTPMWFNINHIANSKWSSTKLSVDAVMALISQAERL